MHVLIANVELCSLPAGSAARQHCLWHAVAPPARDSKQDGLTKQCPGVLSQQFIEELSALLSQPGRELWVVLEVVIARQILDLQMSSPYLKAHSAKKVDCKGRLMQRLPNPPDWMRSEACHRQAARWQLLTSGLHQEQACRDSCMIGGNIKQQQA